MTSKELAQETWAKNVVNDPPFVQFMDVVPGNFSLRPGELGSLGVVMRSPAPPPADPLVSCAR
jgi:hypothetical protein